MSSSIIKGFEKPSTCIECPFLSQAKEIWVDKDNYQKIRYCTLHPEIEDPWRVQSWFIHNVQDNCPIEEYKEEDRSEIRWVDKVSLDSDGNIRDFNGHKIGTGRIIPDGRGGWMYEGTNTEVQYTDGTSLTHTCYTSSRNSDRCDICGALLPNNLGGSK